MTSRLQPAPGSHPTPPSTVSRVVIGGIDTHQELRVAAVIDTAEAALATHSFSTTRAGYRPLIRWMRSFGDIARIGVEGTGSYGAGITRHLADARIEVLEVDRPDRSDRRRKGKDDDLNAISAARAALRGQRTSIPKSKTAPSNRCGSCGSPAAPRSGQPGHDQDVRQSGSASPRISLRWPAGGLRNPVGRPQSSGHPRTGQPLLEETA